ncbi:phage tail protein I [Bacillus sp. B-jedd]|uniref:phage tail protein I n=1 Tax=Bacillus sp. B-jedd TaxID=1476857 RepID=UPI000515621D|nr:phage tail protein I [Bacillus sp. B-jedd]CEG29788.1 Phage tail protein (Tail_P2_I) [Bacillus sp. B-jedd]
MGSLAVFNITNLLPSSLKSDSFVEALAGAFQKEIRSAYQEAESLASLNEVDRLPEPLMDFLAYQKHVDFYETTLPIEQKRELVKKAQFFHRIKGTPAAVEELISAVFGEGKVVEWFEYGGRPYTFKVVTSNSAVTLEKAEQFIRALDSVKNGRSHLEKVEVTQSEGTSIYYAGVIHIGENLEIKQVM